MCAFCLCRTLFSHCSRTQSFRRPGGQLKATHTACNSTGVHSCPLHSVCALRQTREEEEEEEAGQTGGPDPAHRMGLQVSNDCVLYGVFVRAVCVLECWCVHACIHTCMWLSLGRGPMCLLCSLVPLLKTKVPQKRYSAVVVITPPSAVRTFLSSLFLLTCCTVCAYAQEDRSSVPQDIAAYIDKLDRDEDDAEDVCACMLCMCMRVCVHACMRSCVYSCVYNTCYTKLFCSRLVHNCVI